MQTKWITWSCAGVVTGFALSVWAGDSPQWRGAERTGVQREQGLAETWPEGGPIREWQIETPGEGYAAPSVVGSTVYVTGSLVREGGRVGLLYALDLKGNLLWGSEYGEEWAKNYERARSTPTIIDGRVYVFSGMGVMACLDATTGALLWQVDTFERFAGQNIRWGLAESPLVAEGRVICHPGGANAAVVALDVKTGATLWQTQGMSDKSGYCSPMMATLGGLKQVVTQTESNILGLDAGTGDVLWRLPHRNKYGVHPNTPLILGGNRVMVSSGYGYGSELIQVAPDGRSARLIWSDKRPDNHFQGLLAIEGRVYVCGSSGPMKCLNGETGQTLYEVPELTKAALVAAGNQLIGYEVNGGNVKLLNVRADGYSLGGSFKVDYGEGQHWAHPVIANGRLYIRHGKALAAYALR